MAAGDLTTLSDVKAWLGLTDPSLTEDDALLTGLITAASAFIQTICNRQFASQAYTETRDGTRNRRLMFANYPVTAVSGLTIDGVPIPSGDAVSNVGFYFTPTMLLLNGYAFNRGYGNVAIAYTAGYAAIPGDLAQAAIELVAVRYKEKDRIGKVSEGMAQQTTAFSQRDMPASVATLIGQYKKVLPL